MIVSEARLEANRRNARRSTGPMTEEGKERSRQNALTHGLSAQVVHLEGEDDGPEPTSPPAAWPAWLVGQVGQIVGKLVRCERLDHRYRERASRRAEFHWDDDRRLDAEFLGSGIAKDPAGVARSLKRSPQGCDWMIERWSLLARAADRDGGWSPAQRSIASDLLGRPLGLRDDDPTSEIDLEGRPTPGLDPAALARREVAALLRRKADLARTDALEREAARAEPDASDDADLRKLRRHESDLHRRLRWCVAQVEKAGTPPAEPALVPVPVSAPAPVLPPDFPPIDLELVQRLENLMDRAAAENAIRHPLLPTPARPDPRAALARAKQEARRDKRDRRS